MLYKNVFYSILCFLLPLFVYAEEAGSKEVFVEVNQARLFCQVMGKGDPLIVIHGGPGLDQGYLLPQMAKLSENNLVIFYDQRGCGQSTGDINPETMQLSTFVSDLDAIRKAFGFQSISILGHSWGGFVAMQYAIVHPESIDKLIISNSMPATSDGLFLFLDEYNRRMTPFQEQVKAIQESPQYTVGDTDTVAKYFRICFRTYCFNPAKADALSLNMTPLAARNFQKVNPIVVENVFMKPYNLLDQLKLLNIKSLVVAGDSDVIPLSTSQDIHNNLPNSKFLVIKQCGHFPYVEAPDIYFEALKAFLRK